MAVRIGDHSQLEKRLAAYGTMSLAMAAVAIPQAASADIISYTAGVSTTAGSSLFLNVTGGQVDLTQQSNDQFELITQVLGNPPSGPILKARLTGLIGSFAVSASGGSLGGSSVALLKPGAIVGPGLKFATQASTLAANTFNHFGHWNSPEDVSGDVGLLIRQNSQTYYGWANIVVHPDLTITLTGYGWDNTPGTPVVAQGAPAPVPEPASIVLLTLGAAGIAAYRRKQRAGNQPRAEEQL